MFATLFASLFVQGILLGLAALALLAAAPRLQKRYGPQWLCRLWVTLAVLLLVQNHFAGGGVSGSSMSSGNEAAVADTAAYSAAAPAAGAAEDDSVSYEESAMVTAEPNAKNATEKGSAAAEHMDAWVENGNVVFAGTAQITQAQADELLAEYDGKPYFDADRPEAGVIGTGYAMEQADFEKILEALDIPWEAEANPQRTTELYCIVVTADED